jgi:hypothetical protein
MRQLQLILFGIKQSWYLYRLLKKNSKLKRTTERLTRYEQDVTILNNKLEYIAANKEYLNQKGAGNVTK